MQYHVHVRSDRQECYIFLSKITIHNSPGGYHLDPTAYGNAVSTYTDGNVPVVDV